MWLEKKLSLLEPIISLFLLYFLITHEYGGGGAEASTVRIRGELASGSSATMLIGDQLRPPVNMVEGKEPIPVVLWHGMGDSCCNPLSMGYIAKLLRTTLGSTLYVHSLMLGGNVVADTEHGYFANMNELVEEACEKIRNDSRLAKGFNAIGFSQGGLFMRVLAQRCPSPPIFNLISIGGPQQGIYGLPFCPGSTKLCNAVRHLLDYGAYAHVVQRISVQAQFWHDPYLREDYRRKSIFLAEANCESTSQHCDSATYRERMSKLENFVLVKFLRDEIVMPKESEWFGYYPDNNVSATVPMERTPLYQQDLIGLKTLKESGRLHMLAVDGMHLQMSSKLFQEEIVRKYLNGTLATARSASIVGGGGEGQVAMKHHPHQIANSLRPIGTIIEYVEEEEQEVEEDGGGGEGENINGGSA